jgi:hypothetical protein
MTTTTMHNEGGSMDKRKWMVKIGWGRDSRDTGNADANITKYKFKTEAELRAFLEGVSASSGWLEYTLFGYSHDFVGGVELDGLYDDLREK